MPAFVRRAWLLPLDIASDGVSLTRLLVTGQAFDRGCGTVDAVALEDDEAVRAWAVLLTSAAPGSLAVDVEDRDGRLVLRRHLVTRHHRATSGMEGR